MKAMLASNYDKAKLRFPLIAQPKIDGVRGFNPHGTMIGRSLKKHKNIYTTAFYSKPEYVGLDGELAAELETNPDLCRITTSATTTIEGDPYTLWHVFDFFAGGLINAPYIDRYTALTKYVAKMQAGGFCSHLRVVPMKTCYNLEELMYWHGVWTEMGYEGTIIRDPNGMYKQGRSTVREMGLLRIKEFVDEEMLVTGITEGEQNTNVAQLNELGKTFRTSHKEGKVPNGQVGSIQGKIIKDSEWFKAGTDVTIATGTMTEAECIFYFENPNHIVGKIVKFKHFPKGIKDKPRFGQYQSIRSPEDM